MHNMKARTRLVSLSISTVMVLTAAAIPSFAEDGTAGSAGSSQTENQIHTQSDEDQPGQSDPSAPIDPADPTDPTDPTDPADPTDPTDPGTLQAPSIQVAIRDAGLYISWDKIDGAEYYELYKSYVSGQKGDLISNTAELSYFDTSTPSGKTAYYVVYACAAGRDPAVSAEASNRIFRVYIETGHGISQYGRWDSGCRWKKYQEAKLMIPICCAMAQHLQRNGVYVYTDAFNGNKTNLVWTLDWLNQNNKNGEISAFINIHCDYKKAPKGVLALYKTSEQKRLASYLNNGVRSTIKIKNRGLKKRRNLATLNSSKPHCVSVLFECGNIKKDNKILRRQYDAYGKGLAKGLCNYLGISFQ